MTRQLEVVKFRDLVPVTSLPRFVPDLGEVTLEVEGDDFSSVESVMINDLSSPEFIVLNKHKMWVTLPKQVTGPISNIEVISGGFTNTKNLSKLLFRMGPKTRTVSGLLKLIQLFTKWVLQSPGSDIFNLERGGGLQKLIGSVASTYDMQPIKAAIAHSVRNTVDQIQTAQANWGALPLDERLMAATVDGLTVYDEYMEARVRITVKSAAGNRALTSLGL